ncbi:MAG TPA: hypothetical protein VI341_06120 [Actinomycetota bacterium]
MSEASLAASEDRTVRRGHVLVAGLALILGIAGVMTVDSTLGPSLDPGPAPHDWTAWRGDGFAIAMPPAFSVSTDPDDLGRFALGTALLGGVLSLDEDEEPEVEVMVLEVPGYTVADIVPEADGSAQVPVVDEQRIGSTTVTYLLLEDAAGSQVMHLFDGAGSAYMVTVFVDGSTGDDPLEWATPIVGSFVVEGSTG